MANSFSTQDCVKGALQRVGELTDGTSPLHQLALKYVNQVHKDVIKGNCAFAPDMREAWSWARKTAAFQIPGYYSGTCIATKGSVSLTLSVAPTISLQGYFFSASPAGNSQTTTYKIASHTAGSTSATLDMTFIETSNTALSFVALPLIIDIALATGTQIMRLVEPLRIYLQRVLEYGETATDMGRIYGMDPIEFWKEFPLQLIQNDTPSKFITVFRSQASWQIQVNKYTTNAMRVDFDYIPFPVDLVDTSDSIPLLPIDDRDLLEVGAAYYLYMDKNALQNAQSYFAIAQAKLIALKEAERSNSKFYGSIYGQLVPRRDDTAIPYWVIQR